MDFCLFVAGNLSYVHQQKNFDFSMESTAPLVFQVSPGMKKKYVHEKNAKTSTIGPLKNGDWVFFLNSHGLQKYSKQTRVGANLP